jgi:dUTP pyrophosphatase
MIAIAIKRLAGGEGMPLPGYASPGAAGMDLRAASDRTLGPGERCLMPTGFAIALPAGFEAQVRARSGLAMKKGLAVLNAPGTVDSDYRGEIGVVLINLGPEALTIRRGDRIAQLVIAPVVRASLTEVEGLDETVRATGGFGSSGLR